MKILNTDFVSKTDENGKKSWKVDGPLAGPILTTPFLALVALGYALGRLNKR